jgi:electron transfer flavoprotein alpha subunit
MTRRIVAGTKNIWVLPEIPGGDAEISKFSLGLLSEARDIAAKVGGTVTALVFSEDSREVPGVFPQYGVSKVYSFRDLLFANKSAEACAEAVIPVIREEKPWLFIMGNTPLGRELAPRLAARLETALITDCVKIDLADPEKPRFYRPVYAGQLHQEIELRTDKTALVTLDPAVLDVKPPGTATAVETVFIEPKLSPEAVKIKHLEYLPADYQSVDVTDAETVVAAGMGAATEDLLPLVEELAALLGGAIGTTRPVVDDGKIPRERMIGQTGKVVSPDFYLALGISGASHHVGGIRDSGKIVAVNRDPQAPIFRSSDFGISADLKDVLPDLIKRIKRAKENGEIV